MGHYLDDVLASHPITRQSERMSPFKNLFASVIPISFVLGALWGARIVTQRSAPEGTRLKVLAYAGTIPKTALDYLWKKNKTQLDFDWVKSSAEWQSKSISSKYDLLFSYNFQTELLTAKGQVVDLAQYSFKNLRQISVDFLRQTNGDSNRRPNQNAILGSLPVTWGVMGFVYNSEKLAEKDISWPSLWNAKLEQKIVLRSGLYEFLSSQLKSSLSTKKRRRRGRRSKKAPSPSTVPAYVATDPVADVVSGQAWLTFSTRAKFNQIKEKGSLKFLLPKKSIPYWILSVSIPTSSTKTLLAQQVIDEFIGDDIAKIMAIQTHTASANRSIENLRVPADLKPSFFRTLPLRKLVLAQSYWLF